MWSVPLRRGVSCAAVVCRCGHVAAGGLAGEAAFAPGMVSRRSGADRLVVVGAARHVRVPDGSVAVAALLPGPPLPGSAASLVVSPSVALMLPLL